MRPRLMRQWSPCVRCSLAEYGRKALTYRHVLTIPYEIAWDGDTPLVAMAEIDSHNIHPTFWKIALEKHAKRTAIMPLDDVVLDGNDARFVGSIHHITRCGSTSLLQQFGALDRTYGLSEPFIFLELLARASADPAKTSKRVRQLACLFGKGLAPVADHIVVKWPTLLCRHALLLNEALSDVRSVFLVRDAVEILASIEARPLGEIDGLAPELLSGPDGATPMSSDRNSLALTATMLAANCRWIAQSAQTRYLNYAQLPDAGWSSVAPAFGITPGPQDIARMQRSAGINAKSPKVAFVSDTGEKRRDASLLAQSLAEQILQPAIDEAIAAMKSL
jgi:hypothetical protein